MPRKKPLAAPAATSRRTRATKAPSPSTVKRNAGPIGTALKPLYISRKLAADALDMSLQNLVLTAIKPGKLPEYVFGPFCKRILISDLVAYADSCRQGPALTKVKAIARDAGYDLLDGNDLLS